MSFKTKLDLQSPPICNTYRNHPCQNICNTPLNICSDANNMGCTTTNLINNPKSMLKKATNLFFKVIRENQSFKGLTRGRQSYLPNK
jgi:hypothetical protein